MSLQSSTIRIIFDITNDLKVWYFSGAFCSITSESLRCLIFLVKNDSLNTTENIGIFLEIAYSYSSCV